MDPPESSWEPNVITQQHALVIRVGVIQWRGVKLRSARSVRVRSLGVSDPQDGVLARQIGRCGRRDGLCRR